MNFLTTLLDTWRHRAELSPKVRSKDELAFLPAALEIQESPPHPLAHWLGRILMLLFAVGILWACLGKVSIVATAEGKIIPSARLKQIQPLEKGVIKNILVKEGDRVTEGQPLVELDATLTEADKQRLSTELEKAKGDLWRLEQFQELIVGAPFMAPKLPEANQDAINRAPTDSIQDQLLQQQHQQYLAQRASAEGELAKRVAEQKSNLEIIKKLQGTLPLITKRAAAIKGLMEKKMASENDYLLVEEQRITQQQDLATAQANQKQLDAAVVQAEQQLKALIAQVQSETLAKISETRQQVTSLQEELNKATDLNAKQVLYAPVSGQVQGLAITTIGGVVTEAQQLMTIVPEGENLEAEVYLQNKDIGFVQENMEAEIKVHTFPFTQYGIIPATVTRISEDAFVTGQGERSRAAQTDKANDQGLVYTMSLQLAKNTILVNGREVPLQPGMAVTAEVLTGERRIIEFFLAPLLKAKQESIRER